MNSRLSSIIRKEFIQILRDPRTLYITFAIPVVQLFLLGYTATTDVRNVPLAVLDQDRGPQARELLDAYRAADYFRIAFDVDSEAELHAFSDLERLLPSAYEARMSAGAYTLWVRGGAVR